MVEYEREYFEKGGYRGYDDWPHHGVRVEKLINITHPRNVLDVGCAFGYIVRRLHQKGIPAVGCDISLWAGQQSRQVIPGFFVRADMRNGLPFKDKAFDVLYCEGVLEHIEEVFIPYVMREFERVAERRYLQISFPHHAGAKTTGHVCLHDHDWWFQVIPSYTWLALQECGTQSNNAWLYKG